jgi:hypothetical protein
LDVFPAAVEVLIERIVTYGSSVECPLDSIADCRDAKDNYILAIADAGQAEIIISEDADLLILDPWRGVRLLRLFQFIEQFPPL